MTPEFRRQAVLMNEGRFLACVEHGDQYAVDVSMCAIDAAVNVIVRLQGPKAAADFLFAVTDRVTAELIGPTDTEKAAQQ